MPVTKPKNSKADMPAAEHAAEHAPASIDGTIQISDFSVKNDEPTPNPDDIKRCERYMAAASIKMADLLPHEPRKVVAFTISNTTPEFANAIRRILIDELDVWSMTFDDSDFICTDEYILVDSMKKAIELVPINQEIDYSMATTVAKLKIENMTELRRYVFVNDITGVNGMIPSKQILTKLNPGKSLEIKRIKFIRGTGALHSGRFSAVANVCYKESSASLSSTTQSSAAKLSSTAKKLTVMSRPPGGRVFEFSFTTHRNHSPTHLLQQLIATFAKRLNTLLEAIGEITEVPFYSDDLSVESESTVNTMNFMLNITFKKENTTMTDLLAKYAYLEDPNIEFVASTHEHYMINTHAHLKIRHPQYKKLLITSIKKALDDVSMLSSMIG